MAFTWKVEELALKKDREKNSHSDIFSIENKLSRDDKISFIDSQTGGQMSELLRLYDKFQVEKDTIKKDIDGFYKANSLKAWYNRNVGEDFRWSEYDFGFYGIFGERTIYNLMQKHGYDVYEDIVDEAFNNLLCQLYQKELDYFNTHDEYQILSRKLQRSRIFPLLKFDYWYGTNGIGKNIGDKMVPYTLDELRYLTNACDKLEEKINGTAAKIKSDFEKNFPS